MRSTTNVSGAAVTAVTDEAFGPEVLEHDKPVLVDFWAPWCPPCRMIAPVIDEIARERAGSLTVRTMNTDENPVTARNFRIMSLPTLMLFRDGRPLRVVIGAQPKSRLLSTLDAAVRL